MKRILILLVATALIPVFMGIFCPCAKAAPADEMLLQSAPCHGCCPEIGASPECNSILSPTQTLSSFSESSFRTPNVLKALSPGEGRGIAINLRALAPEGDEPLSSSPPQPLYLTLQVLRI